MKNILILLSILTTLSCSSSNKLKPLDNFSNQAQRALQDYLTTCEHDNGDLWNKSLCVPMIIIDRKSMKAVATQQSPKKKLKLRNGFYFGEYNGPQIYANTTIRWGEQQWSTVMWPLPEGKHDRIELLIHEAFHTVQVNLNLPMNSKFQEHLDQYDGRLLIRLEWDALLKSLEDTKRQEFHIANALHFRKLRFKKFPSARDKENGLDLHEGLPAYTGLKLKTGSSSKQIAYLKEKLARVPKLRSLTRSASYYTGPLYGLLLDQLKPDWKSKASQIRDFGSPLQSSIAKKVSRGISLPSSEILSLYNFKDIESFEISRSKKNKIQISKYLDQIQKSGGLRLKTGPTPSFMYDPNGILVVGEGDFIYTSYEVRDKWGVLKVSDGARVKSTANSLNIMVSPPTDTSGQIIKGEGWTLKLNPDWKIEKSKQFTTIVKS